jgi:glutamine cyclotransferase
MKSCTVLLSVVVLAFSAGAADAADEHGHMQVTRERVFNQLAIPIYGYRVVQEYPHDRASYTEGLVLEGGIVYESTGLYGKSKLRRWELRSGRTLNEVDLDARYFGEGLRSSAARRIN